ncbi:MAG TPA: hypothetical protein VEB42_06985, partial [Chitinophagaceae bacterium]|nr:hypothetical protein [Chitinophagaceae bacterium]
MLLEPPLFFDADLRPPELPREDPDEDLDEDEVALLREELLLREDDLPEDLLLLARPLELPL